jgi:Family of unknown function (DUF5995)
MSRQSGWAAAIGVVLALTLAACGSNAPRAAMPPFRLIGNWTGEQWRAIGPTLGGPMDQSSTNICQSGGPTCMDAVVGEMSRRIAQLDCSHLAPFAAMYRQVSIEVRKSYDADRYGNPPYVAHLDSVFATLYFHALDSWRSGNRSVVPQVWRIAFSAAQHQRVSTFGDMLLGMNAHISRDLPFALASVGLRLPDGRTAIPDVVAVNKDIFNAQAPLLATIRAAYDPTTGPPRTFPKWLSPNKVPQIISAWRLEAIVNARDLLNAKSAAARVQVETRIDDTATLRSLLIYDATMLKHPKSYNARHNGYCAGHASAADLTASTL